MATRDGGCHWPVTALRRNRRVTEALYDYTMKKEESLSWVLVLLLLPSFNKTGFCQRDGSVQDVLQEDGGSCSIDENG